MKLDTRLNLFFYFPIDLIEKTRISKKDLVSSTYRSKSIYQFSDSTYMVS